MGNGISTDSSCDPLSSLSMRCLTEIRRGVLLNATSSLPLFSVSDCPGPSVSPKATRCSDVLPLDNTLNVYFSAGAVCSNFLQPSLRLFAPPLMPTHSC